MVAQKYKKLYPTFDFCEILKMLEKNLKIRELFIFVLCTKRGCYASRIPLKEERDMDYHGYIGNLKL